jgi:hypothetical protein
MKNRLTGLLTVLPLQPAALEGSAARPGQDKSGTEQKFH